MNEKKQAATLVTKVYEGEGYIKEIEASSIVSFFENENAFRFIALHKEIMYGTVSLILSKNDDSLPMEELYKEEIIPLRQGGLVAEVVQLAIDKDIVCSVMSAKESLFAQVPLFGKVFKEATEENVRYLCISVNPKHVRFYTMLGFTVFGKEKHYPKVSAPAVALYFDMKKKTFTKNIFLTAIQSWNK